MADSRALRASRGPLAHEKDGELRRDSGAGVENDVADCSSAGGKVTLMPFIKARDQACPEHGNISPAQCPFGA